MRARRATPPRTPPTIGPTGVDFELGEGVGLGPTVTTTGPSEVDEADSVELEDVEELMDEDLELEVVERIEVPVSTRGEK